MHWARGERPLILLNFTVIFGLLHRLNPSLTDMRVDDDQFFVLCLVQVGNNKHTALLQLTADGAVRMRLDEKPSRRDLCQQTDMNAISGVGNSMKTLALIGSGVVSRDCKATAACAEYGCEGACMQSLGMIQCYCHSQWELQADGKSCAPISSRLCDTETGEKNFVTRLCKTATVQAVVMKNANFENDPDFFAFFFRSSLSLSKTFCEKSFFYSCSAVVSIEIIFDHRLKQQVPISYAEFACRARETGRLQCLPYEFTCDRVPECQDDADEAESLCAGEFDINHYV